MKRIIDFIAHSTVSKTMQNVVSIDLVKQKFCLENDTSNYSMRNSKLFQYTGLKDIEGNKIYEGSYVLGQKVWIESDGYLKKKYPKKIDVIAQVIYRNSKFDTEFIKAISKHEEADNERNYRGIAYDLRPIDKSSYIYRKDTTGKLEPKVTCPNIKVIGHVRTDKNTIREQY